jgi:signal transduction histidine kinase
MKAWPFRWKIALYAAILGVVATLAGACTTWLLIRKAEMADSDRRLTTEALELLRDIENFRAERIESGSWLNENIVPLAARRRLIEVRGAHGELLYSSPGLAQPFPDDGIDQIHTAKIGGLPVRVGVFRGNGITVRIAGDFSEVNRVAREIFFGMFGAIPTVLIIVFLGGRWVARRATGPVEDIRRAAERITAKTLDRRLPIPPTDDEIAGLIGVLNSTFDRLERSFEQCVRFSAEASHHLKTPLAVLRAGIEEILTDPQTPAKQQARAADLLHQVHQLTSIAENLLLLARADAGRLDLHYAEFDLREVLDGVCDDARALADEQELTLETKLAERLPLCADRASVALIVQNLIENAVKHNAPGGRVCIDAHSINGEVALTVRNNGDPIPAERAPHIFERFYRARPDGRTAGAGLGLSIASELSKAHGGSLELVRSDAKWTEFRLRLPHAQDKC